MVKMKDRASGVELHVPEEQVENLLAAGFVKAETEAEAKPKRTRKKKEPEETEAEAPAEEPEETE